MSTEEQEIALLKTVPPAVPLTRRDRIERAIGWATAVLAIAAMTVAIAVGLAGASTSSCVNRNLGQRNAPAVSDSNAHVAWAMALQEALTAPKSQQLAEFNAFLAANATYVRTLKANQAFRNAHPLGKC